MPESAPGKILIRTTNWLGDMVLSSGFVRAFIEAFPESWVDLIVKSGFEKIPFPQYGQIIPFDPKKETAGNFGKFCVLRIKINFMFCLQVFQLHGWHIRAKYHTGSSIPNNSDVFCLVWEKTGYGLTLTTIIQRVPEFIGTKDFYRKISSAISTTHEWVEKQLGSLEISLPESFLYSLRGIFLARQNSGL